LLESVPPKTLYFTAPSPDSIEVDMHPANMLRRTTKMIPKTANRIAARVKLGNWLSAICYAVVEFMWVAGQVNGTTARGVAGYPVILRNRHDVRKRVHPEA
jgi:hypothetical protein